ncbi:hypothetical protein HD596_000796 [Nonomuraea jabiensis]|uniref:Uncharacterized protein n=1 Tax=Nonomuraea jabiensis TaxID=882448 RepID=A0A7W9L830_9ACTN|nr:hypothetical protein [Nonomuraea jabiensis]
MYPERLESLTIVLYDFEVTHADVVDSILESDPAGAAMAA